MTQLKNESSEDTSAMGELIYACKAMIKAFDDAPENWLMTNDVQQAESIMKDAVNKALSLQSSTPQGKDGWQEKYEALNELVTRFGKLEAYGPATDDYERLYNIWQPGTFPNENPSTSS